MVEKNANVRASVREGRGGDVSRVWEWIGSLGMLKDGVDSGEGTKRADFRGKVGEVAPDRRGSPGLGGEAVDMSRKWDEGRPIY